MKTYICDCALATFSTIENVIHRAFPFAQVVCSALNYEDRDRFEAQVYFVDDLDTLDDIMTEYEWED